MGDESDAADPRLVPTALVVPTSDLGGAEKRLLGLFVHLRRQGHAGLTLLAPRALIEKSARSRELGALAHDSSVETFVPAGGVVDHGLVRAVRRLRKTRPRAVLHFVLVPPVLAGHLGPRRTVFTVPLADLGLYNRRGQAVLMLGCATAGLIDFLDPGVRAAVARALPWRAPHFRVTPGSFVDLSTFRPGVRLPDRRVVVFSGTFLREKGLYRYLELLPEVNRLLRERGLRGAAFRFLGRDADSPPASDILRALGRSMDVEFGFEPNPADVLATADVIVSLQFRTNYPSKALLEGMAAGCIPVVTDVGRTREMIPSGVGCYVRRDFTAPELAGALFDAMMLEAGERARRVDAMRALLHARFSIEAMARYYLKLYEAAARR